MTALSQEEIISNTKVVMQGLESLKSEHTQILTSLCNSVKSIKADNGSDNLLIEDKTILIKKSIDMIDLGMGEAEVYLKKLRLSLQKRIIILFMKLEHTQIHAYTHTHSYTRPH